ncbi:MAG TPA: hypothetical protein VLF59_02550 [Candidatus Saccharimonadales bacterium]|nr:hypothetical protein [Candidatus Saccharimonadales bacterium]
MQLELNIYATGSWLPGHSDTTQRNQFWEELLAITSVVLPSKLSRLVPAAEAALVVANTVPRIDITLSPQPPFEIRTVLPGAFGPYERQVSEVLTTFFTREIKEAAHTANCPEPQRYALGYTLNGETSTWRVTPADGS